MSQTLYRVTLAVDGNHSVSVQSEDPAAVTEGLVWAQDTYKKLAKRRIARQVPDHPAAHKRGDPDSYQRLDAETGAPICEVHNTPMVWQQGRKGYFWSCHQRNTDGSWCSYKPMNL